MIRVLYSRGEMMAIPEPKVVQLYDGVYTVFTEEDAHLPVELPAELPPVTPTDPVAE